LFQSVQRHVTEEKERDRETTQTKMLTTTGYCYVAVNKFRNMDDILFKVTFYVSTVTTQTLWE